MCVWRLSLIESILEESIVLKIIEKLVDIFLIEIFVVYVLFDEVGVNVLIVGFYFKDIVIILMWGVL